MDSSHMIPRRKGKRCGRDDGPSVSRTGKWVRGVFVQGGKLWQALLACFDQMKKWKMAVYLPMEQRRTQVVVDMKRWTVLRV